MVEFDEFNNEFNTAAIEVAVAIGVRGDPWTARELVVAYNN